jgi:hypothetical protein
VVGAVLLALAAIFGLLNGVPWDRKGAAAEVKADVLREISDMRTDIREIRDLIREKWR